MLISRTDLWTSAISSVHRTLLASAGDLPHDVRQLGKLRDRLGVNVRVLVEDEDIYTSGSSWNCRQTLNSFKKYLGNHFTTYEHHKS